MSNATWPATPHDRAAWIKQAVAEFGFDACGIAPVGRIARSEYLQQWLASGRAGRMRYMQRHVGSREDVRVWLPWARSVIVAALCYKQAPPRTDSHGESGGPRGRVAMYAWGEDYHTIVKQKLTAITVQLRAALGRPFESRICVDTSAITERELAAMAGVGWIGKNTLVLNRELGSYFVIGEIFTDLDIAADAAQVDHCGSCTRCLDACPTQAFPAAYQMDASRCISYLTIEHRGEIDPALAANMGDWVFGCDICQEVCPFNQKSPDTREPRFAATTDSARPLLETIATMNGPTHRHTTAGKATARATPATWRRNARIAAENMKRMGSGDIQT